MTVMRKGNILKKEHSKVAQRGNGEHIDDIQHKDKEQRHEETQNSDEKGG